MINEVALVLLFGLFGWKIAVFYLTTGLVIAIVAGWVIGRLRLEKWVEGWVYSTTTGSSAANDDKLTWNDRVNFGIESVKDIVGKVWLYVLAGIAVGAGIHGYVPQDFMASFMGKGAWWSVPLAVVLGIPMYSNAAGIIPIVQALLGKGAALGTVLAFMMAVIGLSLPEMIILRKVLKLPLICAFAAVRGDRYPYCRLPVQYRALAKRPSVNLTRLHRCLPIERNSNMNIKVLGTGCAKCKKLYAEAEKAIATSGQQPVLEKIEKLDEIMKYGVMMTPALVINEEVKSSGRLPSTNEIAGWIAAAATKEAK